jgi:asparagine synthase (glutamine-hydrolysing)
MAAQFGRWGFDGLPPDSNYLSRVGELLAPYGPDGATSYSSGGVSILYCAFHTTTESRRERQPHISASGVVLTWDGRLDNRADLIRDLGDVVPPDASDDSIVAAAYERWETDCFRRLTGDWALSIWNPRDRSVILAKDPIGVRHMYYTLDTGELTWSTILDPLVLLANSTFALEQEYIAGCLSFFPATHLTPYRGIHAVPPSCFVRLGPEGRAVNKYWDFDPLTRIRYRTDGEYEEHFRAVFAESVRRRLRSDAPILAELSGGMDSSSVVCMADAVIAQGVADTPRLDTLSYYDDSEPNWNERPYFAKVEQKRGRVGCHIDVGSPNARTFEFDSDRFEATPGSGGRPSEGMKQLAARMTSQSNRVVLSGIGGDEVTGGVPTPMPELKDLLARVRLRGLAHQLKVWALNKRKPWFHLLFEAARSFLPQGLVGTPEYMRPAPWLHREFVKRHQAALAGYEARLVLFGPLPSFQGNLATLDALRRQLGCSHLQPHALEEKRYPYLDRDFLQFMYGIPREQLVRPGQRRSLMRRALVGIVPDELLNRKRKAFVARSPRTAISAQWAALVEMTQHMTSSSLGIVDREKFLDALEKARCGQEVPIVSLMRTFGIELWLRNLKHQGQRLMERAPRATQDHEPLQTRGATALPLP